MLDPETTAPHGGVESPERRRARQAAEDVAAWQAAFAAAHAADGDGPDVRTTSPMTLDEGQTW